MYRRALLLKTRTKAARPKLLSLTYSELHFVTDSKSKIRFIFTISCVKSEIPRF